MVKASPNCPKTACPSPEAFKKACECDADDIYIITLSSHLSGTYNSAVLGKELYEEEHGKGKKNILVIDSESASAGELNEALAIRDMYEEGLVFSEISERILKMRDEQQTYFVIDTLEPLRKNGRLTGLQAFFATALNIKPVMGADHGVIIKLDQARGITKGLARMCELATRRAGKPEEKRAVIAHVNCPERALQVKAELEKARELPRDRDHRRSRCCHGVCGRRRHCPGGRLKKNSLLCIKLKKRLKISHNLKNFVYNR